MYSTEISPVVFNPANRVFEALVTFRENNDIERIPCSLRFPIDATPSQVIPALLRQAREKRKNNRILLVSRLDSATAPRAA
ncbi:MAG: hypothetical protein KJO42_15725 [Silicimonas sp.]|nr:hypothetical protein [Silicimonas sp.]NNF92127.1 hypothetical protein [Boseongicola sp.]MBT8425284.1 hypothetical protein [Silicimonas sp.]NND18257.1 hypothetical protein [Silicimonas sp.]NND22248.1 hypothetical protein [Silicimonas sp.]